MKRIIIPAGTVSSEKDYILEIPVNFRARDNDEDSIYILDDKSSKSSLKSLSDFFYDNKVIPQAQPERNASPSLPRQQIPSQGQYQEEQVYQSVSLDNRYRQSPDFASGEYTDEPPLRVLNPEKYAYFKTLGFTESKLPGVMMQNRQEVSNSLRYPRKYMRFNRLGVSDFLKAQTQAAQQQQRIDTMANPHNIPCSMIDTETQNTVTPRGSFVRNSDPAQGYHRIQVDPMTGVASVRHLSHIPRSPSVQHPLVQRITSRDSRNNLIPIVRPSPPSPRNSVMGKRPSILKNPNEIHMGYHQKPVSRPQNPITVRLSRENATPTQLRNSFEKLPSTHMPQELRYPPPNTQQEFQREAFRPLPGTSVISNATNMMRNATYQ